MGFAGSWRAGQQFFKAAGAAYRPTLEQLLEAVDPDDKEWQLLAIEDGRLFEVQSDKGIIEARKDHGYAYGAIGTGASVALGALYVSHDDEGSLMQALSAAQEHSTRVRGPFTIIGDQL